MVGETPVLASVVVLVGANLLAAGLALWLRSRLSGSRQVETGDTIACQECGAVNEAGFEYCEHCVAELPTPAGASGFADGRDSGTPL